MFRFLIALGLLVPSVALAQQPGQGPPIPIAVDLAKVPAGSWAEYNMSIGTMPPMKMRMALVGKTATGNTVETSVEGGMMAAAGGKMVMQTTLTAAGKGEKDKDGKDSDGKVQKLIMQLGANDPMEMPVGMGPERQFKKPDPKTFVKDETVKVAAGSFKTKHYRDKTPQGDTFDFWVTESVLPFGIVKIEGEQKSNPMVKGPFKFELMATGKNGKALITKPAKPFDQAALMKQMMGGQAAAGAPPAAPPAPPAPPLK
jgi:hypothetical protein